MNIKQISYFWGILLIVGVFFGFCNKVSAKDASYQKYFDLYDIKVIHNPAVDLAFPAWAKPNPEQNITDLEYWVDILPTDNRDADKYLVYPEHGVAMPVLEPDYEDQQLIAAGKMFDHYGYLEKGALHYYGDSPDYGPSNMIIAAHSSFNKNAAGDYKTVFQVLPISKAGDKIFLYIKNDAGSYDFYEYVIQKSFETNANNTNILREEPNKYLLTTYGCYAIGDNTTRWANIAKLSQKKLAYSDLRIHAAAPEVQPIATTTQTTTNSPTNVKTQIIQNLTKMHVPLIATTASIEEKTPVLINERTDIQHTPIKTTTKKYAIYEMLKARNAYVIADTLPASTVQSRLIARLQGAPANSVTSFVHENYTITLYKAIVARAQKDSSLLNQVKTKLQSLIARLDGVAGKEKQYAVMTQLYQSLTSQSSSLHARTASVSNTNRTLTEEDKVITLKDGTRFRPK